MQILVNSPESTALSMIKKLEETPGYFFLCSMLMDMDQSDHHCTMKEILNTAIEHGSNVILRPDGHSLTIPGFEGVKQFAFDHPESVDLKTVNLPHWYNFGPLIRLNRWHHKGGRLIPYNNQDPTIWFGGLNWTSLGFESIDIIGEFNHTSDLNDVFTQTHVNASNDRNIYTDLENGKLDVLVDIGRPGKSFILEHELKIIGSAKNGQELIIISQFAPDGVVAKGLYKAIKRGIKVTIITNDPVKQPIIARGTGLVFRSIFTLCGSHHSIGSLKKAGAEIIYPEKFVHGKVVLNVGNAVVTGSKNPVDFSRWLNGMREVSIVSKHPDIVGPYTYYIVQLKNKLLNAHVTT